MIQRSNHIGGGKPESTKVAATGRDVEPILLAMFLPLTQRRLTAPGMSHSGRVSRCSQVLCKSHAQSAVGTQPFMACDFGKPVAVAGLLISGIPFAILLCNAEILELETGARLGGVTSDLSLRGCFVRTNSILEVRARVRLTLARKKQKVEISRRSGGLRRLDGLGVPRYRPRFECNTTVVDRKSRKVWLKLPHQGPSGRSIFT